MALKFKSAEESIKEIRKFEYDTIGRCIEIVSECDKNNMSLSGTALMLNHFREYVKTDWGK